MSVRRKCFFRTSYNHILRLHGYHPIRTPTFEFLDIFGRGDRHPAVEGSLQVFFDREGNTLVLRPDITPSIARCAAKYFGEEELPIGNATWGILSSITAAIRGRLKECTQQRAELLGDPSVGCGCGDDLHGDFRLKAAGLKEFQLASDMPDFFRGLMEAAGLLEEQEEELRELISTRTFSVWRSSWETLNEENLKESLWHARGISTRVRMNFAEGNVRHPIPGS